MLTQLMGIPEHVYCFKNSPFTSRRSGFVWDMTSCISTYTKSFSEIWHLLFLPKKYNFPIHYTENNLATRCKIALRCMSLVLRLFYTNPSKWFSDSLYRIVTWALPVKLLSDECHKGCCSWHITSQSQIILTQIHVTIGHRDAFYFQDDFLQWTQEYYV